MKIFLDTANVDEIKEAVSWGIVDGVTTNPSLMAKEANMTFEKMAGKICQMVPGPVSLEVVSPEAGGMVKEAKVLARIAKNVVIKVPLTIEGIKAAKLLKKEGIKTNVTLVFSANQALLAAKVGATYVSPFLGRLDDVGADSIKLIADIMTVYRQYGYKTEVIAASIRHPGHVLESAKLGCHVATIPFLILKQMYFHPKTDEGIQKFLADWQKVKK